MNLIDAFKEGKVEGFEKRPENIVETQISFVYLYLDKAVKVYKTSDAFFGNLSNKKFREEFYKEDFSWNQWMSPKIYLSLVSARDNGDSWTSCSSNETADDYYIVMNKVNTEMDLTNLLIHNSLTENDLRKVGSVMTEKIDVLTKNKKNDVGAFKRTWQDLLKERLEDLRNFSYIIDSKISKEETDGAIQNFYDFINSSEYIKSFDNSKMVVYIDNHSDNILFIDDEVLFIDIYPVKDSWRAVDPYHNICRTMTDAYVLADENLAEAMLRGYVETYNTKEEDVKKFYMAYNAMIKAAYYYMINKDKLAERYWSFVKKWLV